MLAAFGAFLPALWAGFVTFDDYPTVVENTHIHSLSVENVTWMFTTNHLGHYQPLAWLTLALNYQLSGLQPFSYHLGNLLLHAASALLCYFVARRLIAVAAAMAHTDARLILPAAVAALLFAVHPLRVESVAWVTERRDVLSAAFLLLSVLAYLRACPAGESHVQSRGWLVLSIAALSLSLLAKAWGMVLFAVLIVLDIYPLRRLPASPRRWLSRDAARVLLQKLPYGALGLAAAIAAGWAQRYNAGATLKTLEQWPLHVRLAQACYGLVFYIRKTIWPTNLSPLYELPNPFSVHTPEMYAAYALVVAGAAALLVLAIRRKAPGLLAAVAIYVIFIIPVSGIAQSGPQIAADRYSYLSCISLAILAGGGLLALARRLSAAGRRGLWAAGGAVAAGLFVMALLQARVWHDSEILWTTALQRAPGSFAATNVARIHDERGDAANAELLYRQAVAYNPAMFDAWYLLGNVLKRRGAYVEAEQAYRNGLQHAPQNVAIRTNLGNLYLVQLKRPDDAVAMYRAAIDEMAKQPAAKFSPLPYLSLGVALHQTGDVEGARRALEFAARYPETSENARRELRSIAARETRPAPSDGP